MGDCIMAFWNPPLDDREHATHACEPALAMVDRVTALNVTLKTEAKVEDQRFIPIEIGIGLNSGECCVGNIGYEQRFDYLVLERLPAMLEAYRSRKWGTKLTNGAAASRR